MPKFQPGVSGNPRGRPPGIKNQAKLRAAIAKDLPDIIEALTAAAKGGDVQACKLLLDRVLPALKPTDTPVAVPVGEDLASSGRAVVEAVGAGRLAPEQGARMMQGIGALARIVETTELSERIERLEEKLTRETD